MDDSCALELEVEIVLQNLQVEGFSALACV